MVEERVNRRLMSTGRGVRAIQWRLNSIDLAPKYVTLSTLFLLSACCFYICLVVYRLAQHNGADCVLSAITGVCAPLSGSGVLGKLHNNQRIL